MINGLRPVPRHLLARRLHPAHVRSRVQDVVADITHFARAFPPRQLEVLGVCRFPSLAQHQRREALLTVPTRHIDQDLAALGRGKDPFNGTEIAAYDEAVRRLIARGSAIEGPVIDALRRSSDWAVRLGCIEVLERESENRP